MFCLQHLRAAYALRLDPDIIHITPPIPPTYDSIIIRRDSTFCTPKNSHYMWTKITKPIFGKEQTGHYAEVSVPVLNVDQLEYFNN